MKYRIDELHEFDSAEEAAKHLVKEIGVDEDDFDKYLNAEYGYVEIMGYEYCTSYALKELDPDAYGEEFANWSSEKLDEMQAEYESLLDRMYDGEDDWIENCYIEAFEENEEGEMEE